MFTSCLLHVVKEVASATGLSLVKRSPIGCVCVCVCVCVRTRAWARLIV